MLLEIRSFLHSAKIEKRIARRDEKQMGHDLQRLCASKRQAQVIFVQHYELVLIDCRRAATSGSHVVGHAVEFVSMRGDFLVHPVSKLVNSLLVDSKERSTVVQVFQKENNELGVAFFSRVGEVNLVQSIKCIQSEVA